MSSTCYQVRRQVANAQHSPERVTSTEKGGENSGARKWRRRGAAEALAISLACQLF
jgi:hypothetical protein